MKATAGITDLTNYVKGYVETIPNGFLYLVRMYILHIEVKTSQKKKKNVGKRISLIRRISDWIPISPPKRIYIKVNASMESSNSSDSSSHPNRISQIKASDGLNSIRVLFNTTPDGCICWRSAVSAVQHRSLCTVNRERKMSNLPAKELSLQSESYNFTFVIPGPRASTPLSFLDSAAISSNNSCAMTRITQLEEELASLRQQIASIASMQGSSNVQCHYNNAALPQLSLPPPPPPPPPPPLPPISVGPVVPLKDSIQQSKLKKSTTVKHEEEIHNQTKDKAKLLPHMSDVLKGINKVKLRHVERSPGGSPIRRPALPSASQDPVSLLTAALQRRFARIHPQEISPEKENQQSFDSPSSTENSSPSSIKSKPFGQHLLKPVKKNLKPLAPLTQINL